MVTGASSRPAKLPESASARSHWCLRDQLRVAVWAPAPRCCSGNPDVAGRIRLDIRTRFAGQSKWTDVRPSVNAARRPRRESAWWGLGSAPFRQRGRAHHTVRACAGLLIRSICPEPPDTRDTPPKCVIHGTLVAGGCSGWPGAAQTGRRAVRSSGGGARRFQSNRK